MADQGTGLSSRASEPAVGLFKAEFGAAGGGGDCPYACGRTSSEPWAAVMRDADTVLGLPIEDLDRPFYTELQVGRMTCCDGEILSVAVILFAGDLPASASVDSDPRFLDPNWAIWAFGNGADDGLAIFDQRFGVRPPLPEPELATILLSSDLAATLFGPESHLEEQRTPWGWIHWHSTAFLPRRESIEGPYGVCACDGTRGAETFQAARDSIATLWPYWTELLEQRRRA